MSGPPVAVVTGGAVGIGRAVSARLHQDGYRVVSIARHGADINGVWTAPVELLADVQDPAEMEQVADQVNASLGEIEALVHLCGRRDAW